MNSSIGIRVAILFFGVPRCSEICVPSIKTNIVDVLKAMPDVATVDIYYHLYKQTSINNPRSGEAGILDEENYSWFKKYRGRLSLPEQTLSREEFEQFAEFGDAFNDGGISLRNLLLQLHSLNNVTSLLSSGTFDVAIFVRPDLYYHDPLPAAAVRFATARPEAMIVPEWQWWTGYNDRLAICGRNAALSYGTRYSKALDFCETHAAPLHSESLVKHVARAEKLVVRVVNMKASRTRLGGEMKKEEFRPFEALEGSLKAKLWLGYLRILSRFM